VFKDVSFSYDEKNPAIFKNLNLKIKKNSFVAIVGTSGSGKSTILSLLVNQYKFNCTII
jgi:ABC-type bacteriocin/lantibiotic exporter with double-glycine peptidase domain